MRPNTTGNHCPGFDFPHVTVCAKGHDRRHEAAMADTAPQMTSQPSGLGGLMARPRLIAIGCVVVLAALGWIYLGLMVAGMSGDGIGHSVIEALCRPAFGSSAGD